jgi:xylan 1,4-beta-xylosidase
MRLGSLLGQACCALAVCGAPAVVAAAAPGWARGIENQRVPDLGDGTYLNPILSGDHPDPTILKDGRDYYMTHSSFFSYPGLLIWHSLDLVNWEPVGPALQRNVGSVWAPDLVKYKGRYYIYFPGLKDGHVTNYVVHADSIRGPWSDPVDLKIGDIDPGHVVGPDGKRYLFMGGGGMVPLADDGLSVTGKLKKVYSGWQYPADWVVTAFALEGPKLIRHGGYYHMLVAEGGTAGPPTSHMVVEARAKSLDGPWENSPYNPVVHTWSRDEKWWSKGHGSLVEGPNGKWYLVYHAYENGFWTLGRQTLLEPVEWTADGWLKAAGYDVAKPIPKPGNAAVPHGMALSDDFRHNKMGVQWAFYQGNEDDAKRYRYDDGALVLKGKGSSPHDCAPLEFIAGDQAYQVDVEAEIDAGAKAGLIVFYDDKLYAGMGFDANGFITHRYGTNRPSSAVLPRRMHLRLVNDRNIVTMYASTDGKTWSRYGPAIEVSGYNHNVADGFLSLRPALYAAGTGEVRFRDFRYRALPAGR